MDNLVNEFPSEDNPFVNVGKEVRSKWVPVMGNHDDAGDGSNLARQMAYAGEALKQDHSGNVYWTAQGLHASAFRYLPLERSTYDFMRITYTPDQVASWFIMKTC